MKKIKVFLNSKNKFGVMYFFIQRQIKLNKNRRLLSKLVKIFSPKVEFDANRSKFSFLKQGSERSQVLGELGDQGITILPSPVLSDDAISSIFKQLDGKCLHEPYSKKTGYTQDNIPTDCSCSHYKRSDLVKIPEIFELANDPGLLSVARDYLGATPTISNINLWWGTYREGEAKDNELFHRDKDDIEFIKFFVYLTDVTEDDYNIVYVKNSLESTKAHSSLRYSDQEIIDLFGADSLLSAVGPKGTGFMAANYGVHKGRLPVEGKRTALLQIQYSVRGIGLENYEPLSLSNYAYLNKVAFNPWSNRFLVKG